MAQYTVNTIVPRLTGAAMEGTRAFRVGLAWVNGGSPFAPCRSRPGIADRRPAPIASCRVKGTARMASPHAVEAAGPSPVTALSRADGLKWGHRAKPR